ncbi:MAG TPA: transposase, partial [Luteolibacter sp.]|nr:transposase [Luteolibacter sp.]
SRVVDRRFVLGDVEREKFRTFMRMQENFTGCRVLSYCIMSNHFHILLEVPPLPEGGLSDGELLRRLSFIYGEVAVAAVAQELTEARRAGNLAHVQEIHDRHLYRMHDLSQFMKTLLQRFTRWFNSCKKRKGHLWEERFKSVIVEDGTAARTMAAYVDLNPVRAGMVQDPARYRWSSYGEAMGGGAKGRGKKAREGLVRAFFGMKSLHGGQQTAAATPESQWAEVAGQYRRLMGLSLGRKPGHARLSEARKDKLRQARMTKNSEELIAAGNNATLLDDMGRAGMLLCRVRYFTDGAVIGSRVFVNEAFDAARERFSAKRKDGARRMKGSAAAAASVLWSARDLRQGVG